MPCTAATTPPVPVVLSIAPSTEVRPREVEVAFVMSAVVPLMFVRVALVAVRLVELKLVVVALVPVAKAKSKFVKWEVELAYIPARAKSGVEVALVVAP